MKLFPASFCLIIMCSFIHAQGLERIIVEKYYVSTAKDTAVQKGGHLPIGSITYRIYADLKPIYRLQAVYGVPGHELRIATTTLFFNHEEYGAATANDINKYHLKENTVMLDSWVSVGAGANDYFGISKVDDNGVGTVVNADGILQNDDTTAGVPIKTQDGLIPQKLQSIVTPFGIDTALSIFFGKNNDGTNGPVFSTYNGSWASFGGAIGYNGASDNKVLIGQFTTNGVFSFELNIQIGTPNFGVENYVSRNPIDKEIVLPSLIYPMPAEEGIKKENKIPPVLKKKNKH